MTDAQRDEFIKKLVIVDDPGQVIRVPDPDAFARAKSCLEDHAQEYSLFPVER